MGTTGNFLYCKEQRFSAGRIILLDGSDDKQEKDRPESKISNKRTPKRAFFKAVIAVGIVILLTAASFSVVTVVSGDQAVDAQTIDDQATNDSLTGGGQTFYQTNTAVFSPLLKFPENDLRIKGVDVEDCSITYTYENVPSDLGYGVGDYIVGTSGHDYLRNVTSISVMNDQVILQTTNASLSDVILGGQVSFSAPLTSQPNQVCPTNPNVNNASPALGTPVYSDIPLARLQLPVEAHFKVKGVQVDVSGLLDFGATLFLTLKFDSRGVQCFECGLKLNGGLTLELTAHEKISANGQFDLDLDKEFTSFKIGPFVFTPSLSFSALYSFKMDSSLTTSMSSDLNMAMGIRYDRDHGGWSPIQSIGAEFHADPPKLIGSGFAYLSPIRPEFLIKIWGIPGPFIEFEPYIIVESNWNTQQSSTLDWSVYAGITVFGGFKKVEILGHKFLPEYVTTIYNGQPQLMDREPK